MAIVQTIWKPDIFVRISNHGAITLVVQWIRGSTSCPSNKIFILAPKLFPLFSQRPFHFRVLSHCSSAPFSCVNTNKIIAASQACIYYVTFQFSVTFCNKPCSFIKCPLLLKLLWDKSGSSFYGQEELTIRFRIPIELLFFLCVLFLLSISPYEQLLG